MRAVLRSGLYQILYMEVPAPAAVNEAVKLVPASGQGQRRRHGECGAAPGLPERTSAGL